MQPQVIRNAPQLGAALRRARRRAGLTQQALAERAGLRQATISAIENGEPGTRFQTLVDLMAALELELLLQSRTPGAYRAEDLS